MKDGKASRTAQFIAFCRALETREQPARRPWRFWSNVGREPFMNGLNPDTLRELLGQYRFLLLSDGSTEQIAHRYCPPLGRTEPGNRAYRVAVAARTRD